MSPRFDPSEGFSIFDDKGETKGLVEKLVRDRDPDVSIERMRKLDFSYVFTLTRGWKNQELELSRTEIEESWNWRNGEIEEGLIKKIEAAMDSL
jgi:hypothetical protein